MTRHAVVTVYKSITIVNRQPRNQGQVGFGMAQLIRHSNWASTFCLESRWAGWLLRMTTMDSIDSVVVDKCGKWQGCTIK